MSRKNKKKIADEIQFYLFFKNYLYNLRTSPIFNSNIRSLLLNNRSLIKNIKMGSLSSEPTPESHFEECVI